MLTAKVDILGDIDRRGAIRFDVDSPSTLRAPDGKPIDVIVEDFSRTGFRIFSTVDLPVGTLISLGLSGAGARVAQVMRVRGDSYGCAFMKPLTDSEVELAFQGQEAILANLSQAIATRFATAPAPTNEPMDRVKRLLEKLRRTLSV